MGRSARALIWLGILFGIVACVYSVGAVSFVRARFATGDRNARIIGWLNGFQLAVLALEDAAAARAMNGDADGLDALWLEHGVRIEAPLRAFEADPAMREAMQARLSGFRQSVSHLKALCGDWAQSLRAGSHPAPAWEHQFRVARKDAVDRTHAAIGALRAQQSTVTHSVSTAAGWLIAAALSTAVLASGMAWLLRRDQRTIASLQAAQQALRQSEERYRLLVEETGIIGWEMDPAEWRFTFVSASAEDVLGHPLREWFEPGFWINHLHPEDRERAADCCRRAATGGERHKFDCRMIAADGHVVWLHDIVRAVPHDGKPALVRGVMVDITRRKRVETELAESHERLEERVRQRTAELETSQARLRRSERLASLGTLAAGIAHEINNPLASILLDAGSGLRQKQDPLAVEKFLHEIRKNVERCARIVRGVLSFAREERTEKTPQALNAIVRNALELSARHAAHYGVSIELALADDLPPVAANAVALEQVFVNLIHNAVHACLPGARVILETSLSHDAVVATVRDAGRGMSAEEKARAFDPFYTTRFDQGGTGLGLSTCHGIVTEHGGTIDLDSRPGEGTTVRLCFPATRAVPT